MKTKKEEKLEKELLGYKETLSLCRKTLHRERQKNRDLQESRDKYKLKPKALNERLKEPETIKKRSTGTISEQYIERHKYSDFTVSLCIDLYVNCKCGLRAIVRMPDVLKKHFSDFQPEEIPGSNSIVNWVQKSGYSLYKETGRKIIRKVMP